jgi:sortase (surface protein transpeptidase)
MRLSMHGGRGRVILAAAAGLLVAVGALALVVGFRAQRSAPQPPASEAGTYATPAPPRPSSRTPAAAASPTPTRVKPTGSILSTAAPTHLSIPAIGVASDLIQLGLNSDHSVQVPPLSANSQPGWYRYSPTPGQLGPSIILGHIDSAKYGPGVFFKLGALRMGDTILVTRADHRVAVFRVEAVAEYPKDHFPTLTVYGNTDHAALRLITCGGKFDFSAHSYEDNIVAFASLVSSHPA